MLDGLFRPRTVGVIGASDKTYSLGHTLLHNLAQHGFTGQVFPINPKGGTIGGLKAYPSILEIPANTIDLVNICLRSTLVPEVLRQCGQQGVKFAIIHAAGFKEVGPEGEALELEILAIARQYGMRLFGPNSQGIQNSDPAISVNANITFLPQRPGNISIIARSGGLGEMLKLHLHNAGLGHRMYASCGNQCDLTMPEILAYYGRDEGTQAIMLQTDGFKDPRGFLEAASAITPHKPILAIKAARTNGDHQVISSHTRALADQVCIAGALYRKAGVVEFTDTNQMIQAAVAMSTRNPPRSNRIGIVTNTGGLGEQAAGAALSRGLKLAKWSETGKTKLQAIPAPSPTFPDAVFGNPIDLMAATDQHHYHAVIRTLLEEENTDMVLVIFLTTAITDIQAVTTAIKDATARSDKPVVLVVEAHSENDALVGKLRKAGLPVFEFAEDGARALAAMARHSALRDRSRVELPDLNVDRNTAEEIIARYRGMNRYLGTVDAFKVLAAYGIPVPRMQEFHGTEDMDDAHDTVGYPYVMKIESESVLFKSDSGGVIMDIHDPISRDKAFGTLYMAFRDQDVSYLMMQQMPKGAELIVGVTAVPGVGSLILFGLGGIFVEVMKDVSAAVTPLTRPEARELMEEIRGSAVLHGVRGQPGLDLARLEDLLMRVARLAMDFPEIVEMDLNPIVAYPEGKAPTVVDVLLRVE